MKHKGKPSGTNKSTGTGTPANIKPGDLKHDKRLTQQYTDEDKKLSDQVKAKGPNRNVNKLKATNIHGYRG